MNPTPLYFSPADHAKLRLLLAAALRSQSNPALQRLRDELDRAIVIDAAAIPPDVVTVDSTVAFEDLASREVEEYTLTFPERADIDAKRLSILAPIGAALVGYRAGDTVTWSTPGGPRQLRILRVTAPAPSAEPARVRAPVSPAELLAAHATA